LRHKVSRSVKPRIGQSEATTLANFRSGEAIFSRPPTKQAFLGHTLICRPPRWPHSQTPRTTYSIVKATFLIACRHLTISRTTRSPTSCNYTAVINASTAFERFCKYAAVVYILAHAAIPPYSRVSANSGQVFSWRPSSHRVMQ
jgi:hypothetical protein